MASPSSNSNTENKPKLIVFDLDYTLWPFWVDTHVDPPFSKKGEKVYDSHGKQIKYFPEVPEALEYLKSQGYELAVASRTSEIDGANQLLKLFDWNKYFKYKEIYPGNKVTHFNKFKKLSGIEYKDMLFFDDEDRNIVDISRLGSCAILINNHGVTKKVVQDGISQFTQTYSSRSRK